MVRGFECNRLETSKLPGTLVGDYNLLLGARKSVVYGRMRLA